MAYKMWSRRVFDMNMDSVSGPEEVSASLTLLVITWFSSVRSQNLTLNQRHECRVLGAHELLRPLRDAALSITAHARSIMQSFPPRKSRAPAESYRFFGRLLIASISLMSICAKIFILSRYDTGFPAQVQCHCSLKALPPSQSNSPLFEEYLQPPARRPQKSDRCRGVK